MKKDFILRFLESIVEKLKEYSVNKEVEKVRKSGPSGKHMAESLDKWNEDYKAMKKDLKKSGFLNGPGEFDVMANKEWTKKSLWGHGGK